MMFNRRIRESITTRWKILWGFIGIAFLIGCYSYLSHQQHLKNPLDTTLPNFTQLAEGVKLITTPRNNNLRTALGGVEQPRTFWSQVQKTWLWQDGIATYSRLFKGFFAGCFLSVILGTLMGCYKWLAALFCPTLSYLAKVPGTAMLAVFFVMVGTGEWMFLVMIVFGLLPTLTQAIYLAAKSDLRTEEINKAYTLGASNLEVIWNIVFPKILPKVIDNIRIQIGPSMVYLIAAEMLVGQVGIGFQIRMQQRLLHMNVVYIYLILLGITGLLMDRTLVSLRNRHCPWFGK
jgi:ABC-type nitrate/sulfonate/bicarbonate transport system permease component